MARLKKQHGFTAVDEQPDPAAWVACLDKIQREPFYAAYKKRVAKLLEPQAGRRYLDVGGGTGDDARVLAAACERTTVSIDRSLTMASTAMARGGVLALVGDGASLPFHDEVFDGCRADRVFQHLAEPQQTLDEMIRVLKPGGRLVAVDPDYDTQVMEFPDQQLARKVLRFRAEAGLRNGAIAHRMPAMARQAGLEGVEIEMMTLVVRDPAAVDNVMGLHTWAGTANEEGFLDRSEVTRWQQLYDEMVRTGNFLYAVTFCITSGTKPSTASPPGVVPAT